LAQGFDIRSDNRFKRIKRVGGNTKKIEISLEKLILGSDLDLGNWSLWALQILGKNIRNG